MLALRVGVRVVCGVAAGDVVGCWCLDLVSRLSFASSRPRARAFMLGLGTSSELPSSEGSVALESLGGWK